MESNADSSRARGVDPAEAQEALAVVEQMRRAALRRGLPPRWFGVVVSFLFGAIGGALAADAPQIVNGFLFLALALTFAVMRRTLIAMARRSSFGFSLPVIAVQIGGSVLILATIVGGRVGFTKMGLAWAPFAAAALSAATVYLLFEFKMAQFRTSIELEEQS